MVAQELLPRAPPDPLVRETPNLERLKVQWCVFLQRLVDCAHFRDPGNLNLLGRTTKSTTSCRSLSVQTLSSQNHLESLPQSPLSAHTPSRNSRPERPASPPRPYDEAQAWSAQAQFMFPWEFRRAEGAWFEGGSETWERKGYRHDTDKFRKDVRRTIHHRMADGLTRDAIYATADVGHIFSSANGGSNTLGNIYMQESGFNRCIHCCYDDLNAALVGLERTRRAMKESREFGALDSGPWASATAEEVVEIGKSRFARHGVLTRKNGGLDHRSAAAKQQRVVVNRDGMAIGLKDVVAEMATKERTKSPSLHGT